MKHKSMIIAVVLIPLALGNMPLFGQAAPEGQATADARAQAFDIRALLVRFDADGNGQLDLSERAAVRRFIQRENEKRQEAEETRGRWQQVVERFDTNQDGQLQPVERHAALNAIRSLAGQPEEAVSVKEQLIQALDINRNGTIEPEEQRLLRPKLEELRSTLPTDDDLNKANDLKPQLGLTRRTLIDRFDLNHDGVLDEEERVLARQRLRQGKLSSQDQ